MVKVELSLHLVDLLVAKVLFLLGLGVVIRVCGRIDLMIRARARGVTAVQCGVHRGRGRGWRGARGHDTRARRSLPRHTPRTALTSARAQARRGRHGVARADALRLRDMRTTANARVPISYATRPHDGTATNPQRTADARQVMVTGRAAVTRGRQHSTGNPARQ